MKDGTPSFLQTMLHQSFLADAGAIVARHPAVFAANWRARAAVTALLAGLVGLYVVGLAMLEISPGMILGGVGRLFDIAMLMLPPDPQSLARFWIWARWGRPWRSRCWAR